MKKYFYLLIVALMPMCFIACGGDDDSEGTGGVGNMNATSIYGTWLYSYVDGYEGDKKYSHAPSMTWYYRFNSDNSWFCYRKDRDSGLWEMYDKGTFLIDISNKTISFDYKCQLLELNDKTLKVKESWDNGDYEIRTFTKVDDKVLDDLLIGN